MGRMIAGIPLLSGLADGALEKVFVFQKSMRIGILDMKSRHGQKHQTCWLNLLFGSERRTNPTTIP